jgi:hypothetical protein
LCSKSERRFLTVSPDASNDASYSGCDDETRGLLSPVVRL